MRTLRLSLAGTVIVVLLGGLGGAVAGQSTEGDANEFPTGTFLAADNRNLVAEFSQDGTGRGYSFSGRWEVPIIYAVHGDVFTEMAFDYSDGPQVPATYYWDYDGEFLTFRVWGEDMRPDRASTYSHAFRLVPDPIEVLVAAVEIPAGEQVYSTWAELGIVPAAEAGPDAYTDVFDVMGRIAAVAISEGQPIAPDMLEPPTE